METELKNCTLKDLWAYRLKSTPDKLMVGFQKNKITYSELYEKILLFANGLKKYGINTNDKVALLMSNCPEFIISYFAVVSLGAVIVPINTFFVSDEVNHILKDSGAKIFITSSEFEKIGHQVFDNVDTVKQIIILGSIEHQHSWIKFEELYKYDKLDKPVKLKKDDVAAILYTSGTTGRPKGAMLTHCNLLSNAQMCVDFMKVTQRDKIVMFLPLFHSFSFMVGVVAVIYSGAAVYLMKSVHPFSEVAKTVLLKRITIFIGIPQVYRILSMQKIPVWFRSINPLTLCVSGAAPLPLKVWETFEKKFKTPLLEGYGLTEASPVVSVNPLDARRGGSVGVPLTGISVKIVDEQHRELPVEHVGEIIVKGQNVMLGYYNQPEATKETFTKDGYLLTGDYGKLDEHG